MVKKIFKEKERVFGDDFNKEDFIEKLKEITSPMDFYNFKEKIIKELKGGN